VLKHRIETSGEEQSDLFPSQKRINDTLSISPNSDDAAIALDIRDLRYIDQTEESRFKTWLWNITRNAGI
jgi:hypothetical protein